MATPMTIYLTNNLRPITTLPLAQAQMKNIKERSTASRKKEYLPTIKGKRVEGVTKATAKGAK